MQSLQLKLTIRIKTQRDGKVLDQILLFSEFLEEIQRWPQTQFLRLNSIIKASLKIDHMILFCLIATEIIMDIIFD